MGNTKDTGFLRNLISYDASGNITLPANLTVTGSLLANGGGSYATQSYVTTQITNLINSAPTALDTLNELAAALGNDANFSTTVTNSIASKLALTGGTLTGGLTGTTATFSSDVFALMGVFTRNSAATFIGSSNNTSGISVDGSTGITKIASGGNYVLTLANSGAATFTNSIAATTLNLLYPSNIDKDTVQGVIRLVGQSNTENGTNVPSAGTSLEFYNKWNGGGSSAEYTVARISGRGVLGYKGALQFDVGTGSTAGGTTFTTAITILPTTNVLIGTTLDPGYKLYVNGSGRFLGALTFPGGDRGFECAVDSGISFYSNEINSGSQGVSGALYFGWRRTTALNFGVASNFSTDVTISTRLLLPNMTIGYWDTVNNRIEGGSLRPLLITAYAQPIKLGVDGSENIRIGTNGNLGVGTTTTTWKLSVANEMVIGAHGGSDYTYISGGSGYGSVIRNYYATGTINNEFRGNGNNYVNLGYGSFGVGTSNPLSKLHVNGGKIILSSDDGGYGQFQINASTTSTEATILLSNGGSGINNGNYTNVGVIGMGAYGNARDTLILGTGYSGGTLFLKNNVVTVSGSVVNSGSYKSHTFIQLTSSNYATKTFTFTGNTTGSFSVTDFGLPSTTKALQVYGWYNINGYGGAGSGQGDHASCWFGASAQADMTSWGGPSNPWPGYNNTFTARMFGSFVLWHDGDASNGNLNYYGLFDNGIITVDSSGNIAYNLGHGYSGGTHYVALYVTGYWI